MPAPWVLPDEIVYSELAKSIAAGHRPAVRGVPVFGWGEVYPTLIAPAWALIEDPVSSYHAALGISALVMSLAAVPSYFLARLFVSRRASVLVAAMTVLVPSMAYTGALMTENAFYPVFLLSVLLIARAVQRPSIGRQALALAGLVLVGFTRIQGLGLVGAYLLAILVFALTGEPSRRSAYLRRFRPTVAMLVAALSAPVLGSIARGDGAFGWLGARSGTFAEFHPREVPQWLAYLASDLILYVAVIPVAATAVVTGMGFRRGASERLRLYAAVTLPTASAMLCSVALVSASLDVDGRENLNERYVFYVVPLLVCGLAIWIHEGLPRRNPWSTAVVGVCCLLAASLPIDRLGYNAGFQSVALLPWLDLSLSRPALALVVTGFVAGCGVLWLSCRRERVGRLWLVVGVWMVFVGLLAVGSNLRSAQVFEEAFRGRAADWVDRVVPAGARAGVLWDESRAPREPDLFSYWLMVTEFFNRDVGIVYRTGPPTYYEAFLPTVPVSSGRDGTVVDASQEPIAPEFVLVSCRAPVLGRVVAEAPRGAWRLVAPRTPLRLTSAGMCHRDRP
ncbi:MAG TPA: glycosyltransferase family 39 protein [Gaiella sp.]|nr:glycosyltransferase family 39 protein [Gaiella sp.]